MIDRRKRWTSFLGLILLCLCGLAAAQPRGQDDLFNARQTVLREMAAEVAPILGAGYLAILPPEVMDEDRVVQEASTGWEIGLAEELRPLKGDLRLTERSDLNAILREQKFADSPYADPATAAEVGRIAAASQLFLTRLYQFYPDGATVRVHLEAKLLDVETGAIVWERTVRRGVLPRETQILLVVMGLLLGTPLVLLVGRLILVQRRRALVETTLRRGLARLSEASGDLERSLVRARGRLGEASEVQRVFEALQPDLLRLRSLPGGVAELQKVRDLRGAAALVQTMEGRLEGLRKQVDEEEVSATDLARGVEEGTDDLRRSIDEYRRLFV